MFSASRLSAKCVFRPKNGPVPNQPVNGYLKSSAAAASSSLLFGSATVGSEDNPKSGATQDDYPFTLRTMPRVDEHTHMGSSWKALDEVIQLRRAVRQQRGADVARSWFVPVLDKQLPNVRDKAPHYQRYFDFLETDKELPSGIKDEHTMRGLALPLSVLEKIYFRNAMRIYPHVGEALTQLGYFGQHGTKQAARQ